VFILMVQSASERALAFNAALCFGSNCRRLPQSMASPACHRHRMPMSFVARRSSGLIMN
jgi:hypothetical protein